MNKILLIVFVLLCVIYIIECVKPVPQSSWVRDSSWKRLMEKQREKARLARQRVEKSKIKREFRPTSRKCCKLGEKAARKKMACTVDVHMVAKNRNVIHKAHLKMVDPDKDIFVLKMVTKLAKCGLRYSKYFEKCCHFRAAFEKEMNDCRRLRVHGNKGERRFQRKRCKKVTRQKYN